MTSDDNVSLCKKCMSNGFMSVSLQEAWSVSLYDNILTFKWGFWFWQVLVIELSYYQSWCIKIIKQPTLLLAD